VQRIASHGNKIVSVYGKSQCTTVCIQVPIYASYLYDAVSLYAKALRQSIDENVDVRNGAAILAEIKGRNYQSESNETVRNVVTARP